MDLAAELAAIQDHLGRVLEYVRSTQEPPFVPIWNELPVHPEKRYNERLLTDIEQIVIHHVGVDAEVSPERTAEYHVKTKDWPGIGYHFYIRTDGRAYQTQPLETVSYHCGGECNRVSVGICLEGSFMDHEPPPAQLEATKRVIEWLWLESIISHVDTFVGHREIRQTACPGNTWPKWKEKILP